METIDPSPVRDHNTLTTGSRYNVLTKVLYGRLGVDYLTYSRVSLYTLGITVVPSMLHRYDKWTYLRYLIHRHIYNWTPANAKCFWNNAEHTYTCTYILTLFIALQYCGHVFQYWWGSVPYAFRLSTLFGKVVRPQFLDLKLHNTRGTVLTFAHYCVYIHTLYCNREFSMFNFSFFWTSSSFSRRSSL